MSIFCHNCGKSINQDDVFCEFCGTNIKKEKEIVSDVSYKHKTTKRVELENKAWYRGVKVLYIFLVSVSFLAIIGISWSVMPEKTIDGYGSSILCHNGKSYAPAKNGIYLYGSQKELDYTDDKNARILCKYETLGFYNYQYESIEKNYTFIPKYSQAEYGDWFGGLALALFVFWVISYLTKITFFYVAIGEKPKIKIPD